MLRALAVSLSLLCPLLVAQEKGPAEKETLITFPVLVNPVQIDLGRLDQDPFYFFSEAFLKGQSAGAARSSPTKQDKVQEALLEVERAARRARRLTDSTRIQEQINKAEKALMKARQELWKRMRQEPWGLTVRRVTVKSLPAPKDIIPHLETKVGSPLSKEGLQLDIVFFWKEHNLRAEAHYVPVKDGVQVIFHGGKPAPTTRPASRRQRR